MVRLAPMDSTYTGNLPQLIGMPDSIGRNNYYSIYGNTNLNSNVYSGDTYISSKNSSGSIEDIDKANRAKKKKAKEKEKHSTKGTSKLFPNSNLTKEHDVALEKLLKQMHDAGYKTPITEYAMEHGLMAFSTVMWAPLLKPVGNFFGGSAAAKGVYKYTGAEWTVNKCKSGYQYVRNSKVVKPVADIASKPEIWVTRHGVEKVERSAKLCHLKLERAGDAAKLGTKAATSTTKTCATGLRYVAKYGAVLEAGMTVYDDKDKLVTAWKEDASTGLKQTGQTAAKATGAGVGFWAGTKVGALLGVKIGGIIGACFGGVGAPVGAAIGGFIGGLAGGIAGAFGGKKLAQAAVGPDAADKVQENKVMKEKQDEKWIKENINIYTEMAAYVEKVGANNVDAKALEALNLIMQANPT